MKATLGPVLFIFSGLPASGKTTLGKMLARQLNAAYLRIDTVEQGLRDLCNFKVEGEGYRLSYRIAKDNLELGTSVVADSCNTITLTRKEWEETALTANARFVNIEISCSDKPQHRARVEGRANSIQNLKLPNWEKVENRHYEQWQEQENVLKIDTAGQTPAESFEILLSALYEKLKLEND